MKKLILITYSLLVTAISINAQGKEFPKLTGPYLGMKPQGNTPEIFAPNFFISLDYVRDVAFTPDGKEFFFYIVAE